MQVYCIAMNDFRTRLVRFVDHPRIQGLTTFVILLNAVTLGLETSPGAMAAAGGFLHALDRIALGYFVVEVALRLVAHGKGFFRSGWGWFDLIIVSMSLIPNSGSLSVLRALRILRALRLFSTVPALRRVVGALVSALPGMGSIAVVLGVIFYVSAVLAAKLFGTDFPAWFGGLGASLYTLFQIMTLESWSMGIVRPVLEVHSWAWIFFVPFIVITSFAVLNLFIGVIVSALQEAGDPDPRTEAMRHEIDGLREDLREVLRRLPSKD
jgi:voltage-gated sodium channel